jgi:hypothetical protein
MPIIYHVRYNKFAIDKFLETSPGCDRETWWTFDPRDRYYDIVETKEVPYFIEFASSYRGEFDFELTYQGERKRVELRLYKQEYEVGVWNYTAEEFETQVNGAWMIPHFMGGYALPDDVFEVMKLMYPNAIRGHYDHEKHGWVKDEQAQVS